MLAYLKEPMGCSTVDGYRVYGKFYDFGSFGPTNIPRRVYSKYRTVLEEAEITRRWLSEAFDCEFPDVTFKATQMIELDFDLVVEIARCMDVSYIQSAKPTATEKRALRETIKRRIEQLI